MSSLHRVPPVVRDYSFSRHPARNPSTACEPLFAGKFRASAECRVSLSDLPFTLAL
jgi:hypothetical protein